MSHVDTAPTRTTVGEGSLGAGVGPAGVEPASIIAFPDGIPGFESCHEFVLVEAPDVAPLRCLQSVSGPGTCFLAIDPTAVLADYRCSLGPADRAKLDAPDGTPLVWLALVMVGADDAVSVNLRAPVVINPARMIGRQVVPNDTIYPLRYVLQDQG